MGTFCEHNGLRTQKKVTENGVETITDYTLHGKLITHLTQGSNNLHFYYDANSRPAMVDFNGTMYTYIHNLQGDVVAILDTAGTIMVEYKYDAWGRIIATTGSKSASLGKLNPFRYRGYVYDEETGLYYLRSRYYAPDISRFIGCEFMVGIDESVFNNLLVYNLFAYCQNCPILCIDEDGDFAFLAAMLLPIVTTVIEAVIYTTLAVGTAIFLGVVIPQESKKIHRQKETFETTAAITATVLYASAHRTTKNGSKKRTNDKHTKKRPGSDRDKAKLQKKWKYRGNKKTGSRFNQVK